MKIILATLEFSELSDEIPPSGPFHFFFSLSFTNASKSIRFYQKASDSTRVQCRSSSYVSVDRMTIAEMNSQSVPIRGLPNNRLTGADLGWGSEAAAAATFSSSEIFFCQNIQ